MEKNYEVWFHVNDNEVTKQHNDHMLVGAENPEGIIEEFKRRIDSEFDYKFSDVDLTSLDVYEREYDMKKSPIDLAELKIPEFLEIFEKEIDFTNKVDEREEVLDEGETNAMLYLDDNDYKALYLRGNLAVETGMTFNEMLEETDMLMNAYAVEKDDEMKLYVTCDDAGAYISLSENELESLVADVGRAIEARGEQDYLLEDTEEEFEFD